MNDPSPTTTYVSLPSDPDPGVLERFWSWLFPSVRCDPYTQARRELRDEFTALVVDLRAHDARLVSIYENFWAHVQSGRDPQLEHFRDVVAWYKRNHDEMHSVMVRLLAMHAVAKDNPSQFTAAWEPVPEEIRQARRKWTQKFTPANATERAVDAAFELPRKPPGTPLDCETDCEY